MFDIFKKLEGLRPAAPTGPVEAIVAGLGNPGREYENTRHNAGFLVLDQIAGSCGVRLDRLKYKSLCADAVLGGRRVLRSPTTGCRRRSSRRTPCGVAAFLRWTT